MRVSTRIPRSETKTHTHCIFFFNRLGPPAVYLLQDGVLQVWASGQNSFIPLMFFSLSLTLGDEQCKMTAIPNALQAANFDPKSLCGRHSGLSSCSSVYPGVHSWKKHSPTQLYGPALIFSQNTQPKPQQSSQWVKQRFSQLPPSTFYCDETEIQRKIFQVQKFCGLRHQNHETCLSALQGGTEFLVLNQDYQVTNK